MNILIRILFVLLFFPGIVFADGIYHSMPKDIEPDVSYIFYSHGKIVEGDIRPTHPRWGVYEFEKILESLNWRDDIHVIAEHRPKGADVQEHADKLVGQINRLLAGGVKVHKITVIGFSKGGVITALAANQLSDHNINIVLLGSCRDWLPISEKPVFGGHVLTIYESSDDLTQSCNKFAVASNDAISFESKTITTGKEHGAFYVPHSDWIVPLKRWLELKLDDNKHSSKDISYQKIAVSNLSLNK